MSFNYNPQRGRNLFLVESEKPFKLSRSKIEDFFNCPRCFYLDRKCGTGRPPSYPFTLNNAVDALLKKEFDWYRSEGKPHPLCVAHGVDAIPFSHPQLDEWRINLKGVHHMHEASNFIVTGAIDDLWINPAGELIVVDYKATSTIKEITLDEPYRQAYKRQMEIYQWLLRRNGFQVSNTGYFVYCNGDSQKECFSGRLDFKISLLPYEGNDSWIEGVLQDIKSCLMQECIPEASAECSYCKYCHAIRSHLENANTTFSNQLGEDKIRVKSFTS